MIKKIKKCLLIKEDPWVGWVNKHNRRNIMEEIKTDETTCPFCNSDRSVLACAASEMLAVLEELQESASYWSEYDVPLGIVDRINAAINRAYGRTGGNT
jgi:uncharacterized protein with PIN domain